MNEIYKDFFSKDITTDKDISSKEYTENPLFETIIDNLLLNEESKTF